MTPKPESGARDDRGSGKLGGKAALITGGDSGVGRSVAVLFAEEGAGVLISYLDEEKTRVQRGVSSQLKVGRSA